MTLAKIDQGGFPLVTTKNELQEIIGENFAEGEAPQFDRVKFPSAGSGFYTLPGIDGDESAKTLEGVVLAHHPARALYAAQFDGKTPPLCVSMDGLHGEILAGDGEFAVIGKTPSGDCRRCPFSEFGGGCKALHRVYILRAGEAVPVLLTLPVMSAKPFEAYRNSLLRRRLSLLQVLTRFGLETATNTGGIKYSKATVQATGTLTPEMRAAVKELAETIRPYVQKVAVGADDYNVIDAAPAEARVVSEGKTPCAEHDIPMSLYYFQGAERIGHLCSDGSLCQNGRIIQPAPAPRVDTAENFMDDDAPIIPPKPQTLPGMENARRRQH